MSSTLLYRAFGFRDYQVLRTTGDDGILTLHLRQDPKHDRCSACRSANVIRHGVQERILRTVPLGGKPVALHLPVPRLGCRDCGLVRQAASSGDNLQRLLLPCQGTNSVVAAVVRIKVHLVPTGGSPEGNRQVLRLPCPERERRC